MKKDAGSAIPAGIVSVRENITSKKDLSNPFSTGGGGVHFEVCVQASFVTLMLSHGFAPCMPCFPITKIKLQGKYAGFETDDLIVFVTNPANQLQYKLLAQIKHSITISENSKIFGEVIVAAWEDFNNPRIFSKNRDSIALITGPLSAVDINDVRTILEWARAVENADEFFRKVNESKLSSENKRRKIRAFKTKLERANEGKVIPNQELFEFLRHFYLIGYDLDIKAGVTLSFLQTLIGQYSPENASLVWAQIVDEVAYANQNAGTLTRENLPPDLLSAFSQRGYEVIPSDLLKEKCGTSEWAQFQYATELAAVNLLGSWNENNEADINIVAEIANEEYSSWISKIRESLYQSQSPLSFRNGKWVIHQRKMLWHSLGARLFDDDLERFLSITVKVLSERNPEFDLLPGDRFASRLHGKVMKYSPEIRKGFAESLVLLSGFGEQLQHCSQNTPKNIVALIVRQILSDTDWRLWGSLDGLLPLLAEAAPREFLSAVENTLQQKPCPFTQLFKQESFGILGRNYLNGLFSALEILAWNDNHLIQVSVILGKLAELDLADNSIKRPERSLGEIFLPWHPHTIASIEKRVIALKTLQSEVPEIGWKVLLDLLPNHFQTSRGTRKPLWINTIPENYNEGITRKGYFDSISKYSELVVSIARQDIGKLSDLIEHIDDLPKSTFNTMIGLLSSEEIMELPEKQRLPLWENLLDLLLKHKRYPDAKWVLGSEDFLQLEKISNKLSPQNPILKSQRLFTGREHELFDKNDNWEEQLKSIRKFQEDAIKEILDFGGIDKIFELSLSVESAFQVGQSLGFIGSLEIDIALLPNLLVSENNQLQELVRGYIWRRQIVKGWSWIDKLDRTSWTIVQKGKFLSNLPFTEETWTRVDEWLGENDGEYWKQTYVNPYVAQGNIEIAIDKLLVSERPLASIECLSKLYREGKKIDVSKCVKALLSVGSTNETSNSMDSHRIVELIKYLQNSPEVSEKDLFDVEWAYLSLLDYKENVSPEYLTKRLASEPEFFCEAIQLLYRSRKEMDKKSELGEEEKAIAENLWPLLHSWKKTPGIQPDGSFSIDRFSQWFDKVKELCLASGHLEIALEHVGQVLVYCPPDPDGLWIDKGIANELNAADAEHMRIGFRLEIFNSRGVHWIDPTGKPERELAEQYRQKADEVENAGFYRLATTLRDLADSYQRDAERIIEEHSHENDE